MAKTQTSKTPSVREELCRYGARIAHAHLVAGAGGNISAREGDLVWMKPSGFAMDELTPDDFCGLDLATGRQVKGDKKPTSEFSMHLAIYRARRELTAVFHTHSPWASGVISSRAGRKPMFTELVRGLGRVGTIPYVTPTTQDLADTAGEAARAFDTILMVNHGVLALGVNMKQAYDRCVVVEDAAMSMVAAAAGRSRLLNRRKVRELMALDAPGHRIRTTEGKRRTT